MNRVAGLCAALFFASLSALAGAADYQRGKLLYDARCVSCHDKSVHNRNARKALTVEAIRAQVLRWDAALGGAWRDEEVDDVTLYLNELFYRYPCPPAMCPDKKTTLEPATAHVKRR